MFFLANSTFSVPRITPRRNTLLKAGVDIVYARHVESSPLDFSLSSHRHSYIWVLSLDLVLSIHNKYWGTYSVDYLVNVGGPVSLVLDLRIDHDRFASRTDPSLNGQLHYPNDIDKSLNETVTDKMRKYHTDYNNNPLSVVSFIPDIPITSGRLHSEFIRLLFLQTHRETDRFFATSGVQITQPNRGLFHFHHVPFSATLKTKVGSTLAKTAALRVNLNVDGVPIPSKTRTHPTHSETSRLLNSSLSSGVPVPRTTQCM
jgi:hypothetical protein